jgi:hypothetical protein
MLSWETVGRIADVFSIVGFSLAIIGLYVALSQLKRTQKAVEAAEDARVRTERDAALRQLLVLLPTLIEVEQALDEAVAAADFPAVRRELATWRSRGGDVMGMVTGREDLPENLHDDLAAAIVQAAAAKQRLLDESVDIIKATQAARLEISQSVAGLTDLSGRLKAYRLEAKEDE